MAFPKGTRKQFKEFHADGTDSIHRWHDVFMRHCDPTEYAAAIELVGTWTEWQRFKRDWPAFNNILAKWLEEVEIKIRSGAVRKIVKQSENEGAAARFLAEGKYLSKEKRDLKLKANRERETGVRNKVFDETDEEVSRVKTFMRVVK